MAETTTHNTEMTRKEAAEFLQLIADELHSGQEVVSTQVENKEVRLSPSETIDTETTITGRSRRFRESSEEMGLEFKWNSAKDTAESESGLKMDQ